MFFFARSPSQANDSRRIFHLSALDIASLNPLTKTCPVFRNQADAELTKKIYRASVESGPSWTMDFSQGLFNMSSDSGKFVQKDYVNSCCEPTEALRVWAAGQQRWVPLYEGRMIWHFDHRFGTYEGQTEAQANKGFLPLVTDEEHANPEFFPEPAYWVEARDVSQALAQRNWNLDWIIGWRDVTNNVSVRTAICAVIPTYAVAHSLSLVYLRSRRELAGCFLGNFASLVLDYACRQKVSGSHLTFSHVEQLPFLSPAAYTDEARRFIDARVLELSHTSVHTSGFAATLGYDFSAFRWDSSRRENLRAELDAYFARLYGLTREELRYVLDPQEIFGSEFPSETFRVLKNNERRTFGEFRTARLVLAAWDRFECDGTFAAIAPSRERAVA